MALLLGMAAMALPAAAQPDPSRRTGITLADAAVPGWDWQWLHAASADGQRQYRIRVAVPQRQPPATGFPVAYLLDGNAALMETDAALLRRLAASARPPVMTCASMAMPARSTTPRAVPAASRRSAMCRGSAAMAVPTPSST